MSKLVHIVDDDRDLAASLADQRSRRSGTAPSASRAGWRLWSASGAGRGRASSSSI